MPRILPIRNIDKLVGNKAVVYLKNGKKFTGKGKCICWLPNDENEDIDDELIRFDIGAETCEFFTDEEIEKIELYWFAFIWTRTIGRRVKKSWGAKQKRWRIYKTNRKVDSDWIVLNSF